MPDRPRRSGLPRGTLVLLLLVALGPAAYEAREPLVGKLDAGLFVLGHASFLPRQALPELGSDAAKEAARAAQDPRDGYAAASRTLDRHYEWVYHGVRYSWDLSVDAGVYDYFRGRPRNLDPRFYDQYVMDVNDDPILEDLSRGLAVLAETRGFSRLERANFVLAFIQGLRYLPDDVYTGSDDYPKYPLETLVEEGGDCEDTSILLASLLVPMGEDAALLLFDGHMATGLRLQEPLGGRFEEYLYGEGTRPGWRFGEVPSRLRQADAMVLSLTPSPLPEISASAAKRSGGAEVRVRAWNNGTAPATGIEVYGRLEDDEGRGLWSKVPGGAVPPGESRSLSFSVRGGWSKMTALRVILVSDSHYLEYRAPLHGAAGRASPGDYGEALRAVRLCPLACGGSGAEGPPVLIVRER